MNSATSKKIILASLPLAFAIPIIAQMQQTSAALSTPARIETRSKLKSPQTKILQTETPKISPELEAKLVALLKAAGSEADAYFNLAFVCASQDRIPDAKTFFRKALAVHAEGICDAINGDAEVAP